jgi:tetratricopeptide (TPR) repeat protein
MSRTSKSLALSAVLGATGVLLALASGCRDAPVGRSQEVTTASAPADVQAVDELTMALESLRDLYGSNSDQAASRTIFYLNQWLGRQEVDRTWTPDPMLETLPSSLKGALARVELERLSFSPLDLAHLKQWQWFRDIAERIRVGAPPEHLQPWLKQLEKTNEPRIVEQIIAAEAAFDWTIRNIRLDELPPPPKGPSATVGGDPSANTPPLRGELGPGYGHTPANILLYGHGDAWERSRIFLLLARQLGIEGAMLAISDPQSTGTSNPWCCGLLIGDELYLFDAELGLPLPNVAGDGIATLRELGDHPEILRSLDLGDGAKYRIREEDLKRIVALIEAEPDALSHRMQILQKGMKGKDRMMLSLRPSELQKRLRSQKRIGQISLWQVPFEALLYQTAYIERVHQDPRKYVEWNQETGMFRGQHPLLKARDLHFQGRFEREDQDEGARTLYLSIRPSEKAIDKIGTSTAVREELGLQASLPEDEAQRAAVLESIVTMARRAKQHATYWLGLSYYEQGNYQAAKEWLARSLEAKPSSPWQGSARYNLARTYEQLGDYQKAIDHYRADSSPQRHGNRVRAKQLESRSKAGGETSAPAEDDEATNANRVEEAAKQESAK